MARKATRSSKAGARIAAKSKSSGGSRSAALRRSGASKRASASSRRSQAAKEPKDLGDLFMDTLKDLYHAEKQLIRALPKMAKAAQSDSLRQAFQNHARETEIQAERLERIFEMSGQRPATKPCHGMLGLLEEGNEVMKEFKGSEALDAGLLAAAQAVEHYEISRYGTMREWASQHGMQDVARLLEQSLEEEKRADRLLTQIAEQRVNREAA
jgi:ferritin-like metal-binding protein YciE